jgi:hypothetical protein
VTARNFSTKRGKQIYFLRTILFFEWTNFIFISNQKIKEERFIFVSPLVLSWLKKEKKNMGREFRDASSPVVGVEPGRGCGLGWGQEGGFVFGLANKNTRGLSFVFCCSIQHAAAAPSSACSPAAFLAEVLH